MALGSLLAAGGSILGGLLGNDDGGVAQANAYNMQLNNLIRNLFRESQVRSQIAYNKGEKRLRETRSDVLEQMRRARDDIGGATRETQRTIRDREQQSLAGAAQGLIGRGLSNSSLAPLLQRGIAADTNRQIGAVNQRQAQLTSGINQNIAQVKGNFGQALANLPIQGSRDAFDINNAYANALNQQAAIPGAPSTAGSELGGLLGQGLGGFIGDGGNLSGLLGQLGGFFG